jgi:hypothetical protein
MDASVKVMSSENSTLQPTPLILDGLPDIPLPEGSCPRRARWEIDLMLLAIEALDISGSEAILYAADELGLHGVIKNRVALWRMRNTNPLRRQAQRRPLSLMEAKALVMIGCSLARRLTVLIRQLLLAHQQLSEQNLSMDHHYRLQEYLERFRAHFRSRMNPKRAAIAVYTDSEEKLNQLAIAQLSRLLFCTGTHGMQRFWISLFDGEVV